MMLLIALFLSITLANASATTEKNKIAVRESREVASDYSIVRYNIDDGDGGLSSAIVALGKKGVEILRRQRQRNRELNTAIPELQNTSPPSDEKQEPTSYEGLSIEVTNESNTGRIKPEANNIVQVYRNANCNVISEGRSQNYRRSERVYANLPAFRTKDIVNRGYDKHSRKDRFYADEEDTNSEDTTESVSKLVESTQDLISNEDLLEINGAAETDFTQNDDLIKVVDNNKDESRPFTYFNVRPTPPPNSEAQTYRKDKSYVRNDNTHPNYDTAYDKNERYRPKNDNSKTLHQRNENSYTRNDDIGVNNPKDDYHTVGYVETSVPLTTAHPKLKSANYDDHNSYQFATPIVVPDTTYNNLDNQLKAGFAATVAPYISQGYEISGVKQFGIKMYTNDTENHVSGILLSPITVGLRLANSNQSDLYNSLESENRYVSSRNVAKEVNKPREVTTVEIQKAIPIEITDFERNFGEGRNNFKDIEAQIDEAEKQTYGQYRNGGGYSSQGDDLRIQEIAESAEESKRLEAVDTNERKESIYGNQHHGQRIIQPIIIEKEVPVTKFVDRYIEKKVPVPTPYEVVKEVRVEKPVPYPVPYEKVVEKPVEVTRYVERPHPVEVKVPHPVPYEVKVPYPVEKKIYVEKNVPVPVEKVVEKKVLEKVPVPTPVGVPYEVKVPYEQPVLFPIPIDKPYPVPVPYEKEVQVDRIVERRVPYAVETRVPMPYPVETKVPYPVDRIVEKPVHYTQVIEKQVPVKVPVAVPVPQPYPVNRYYEKKVPYPVPVEKVVEKKVGVPIPVSVPYPVEKIVEKVVEKQVPVTKYINRPYPVETMVPYPVPYERVVEKKVPVPIQIRVPYGVRVPYAVEKIVERPVHIPYPVNTEIPSGPAYNNLNDYLKVNHNYAGVNHEYARVNEQAPINRPHIRIEQLQTANTNNNYNYEPVVKKNHIKEIYGNNVKSTPWGNLYASSYQYTSPKSAHFKKTANLSRYINYITNNIDNYNLSKNIDSGFYPNQPPLQMYSSNHHVFTHLDGNDQGYYPDLNVNKNDFRMVNSIYATNHPSMVKFKLRRNDRTGKRMKNLRIEYGGFRPPMVPSIEVDLDGIPVKKDTNKS